MRMRSRTVVELVSPPRLSEGKRWPECTGRRFHRVYGVSSANVCHSTRHTGWWVLLVSRNECGLTIEESEHDGREENC